MPIQDPEALRLLAAMLLKEGILTASQKVKMREDLLLTGLTQEDIVELYPTL